jgi:hypothetical protein
LQLELSNKIAKVVSFFFFDTTKSVSDMQYLLGVALESTAAVFYFQFCPFLHAMLPVEFVATIFPKLHQISFVQMVAPDISFITLPNLSSLIW